MSNSGVSLRPSVATKTRKPSSKPHFLVADDSPDDRQVAAYALSAVSEPSGARIDFVEDGEELMEYLERRGRFKHLRGESLPDFLLLDLNMPKKSGVEALLEIRASETLRELPVVVLSTSRSETDKGAIEELEPIEFMTKPDEFAELTEFCRRLARFFFDTDEGEERV